MFFLAKPRSWLASLTLLGALASLFAAAGAPTAAAATSNLAPTTGALYGARVPGGQTGVTSFESSIGRKLAIDHRFWGWTDGWPASNCEGWDVKNGRIPMVSWDGPFTTLASITNGSQDAVIRSRATAVKNLGAPILIRWGYEMNGKWFPWSGSQNGNDPTKYVAAWRHIVDLFRSVGATNALWVWAPNVGDSPKLAWNHWTNYYPGDNYVDWVGMDGYNWGTTQSWSSWQSFGQIFGGSASLYNDYKGRKPIMVAESGTAEQGGDKGAWWRDVAVQLKTNFTGIKAVVFLNDYHNSTPTSGVDWRAQSSSGSLAGYRTMVGDSWLNPGAGTPTPPPPPPPAAPVNSAVPTISGTTTTGQILSASTGVWSGSPSGYAYQWSRCDSAGATCIGISGASGSALQLGFADLGTTLRVAVTATNSGGSATATSSATAVVVGTGTLAAPALVSSPLISGALGVGQALTASPGGWSGAPSAYTYQWQRLADYAGLLSGSSPLGYWRLGERSGSSAADASGHANNGTYSATTLGVTGAVAQDTDSAASFGSGNVAFGDRFDFAGNATFTLEAWVKPTKLDSTYRRLFAKEALVSGNREGLLVWLRSDGVGFERWSGGVQSLARSTTALPLNVYSHVVATYDGSTMRLYVNGNLVGSTTSTRPLANTNAPFVIGSSSYGGNNLVGSVDEAVVYDRAVSQTVAAQHVAVAAAPAGAWTNIAGATAGSYTVGAGDLGYRLRAVVTASNAVGAVSASTAPSGVVLS